MSKTLAAALNRQAPGITETERQAAEDALIVIDRDITGTLERYDDEESLLRLSTIKKAVRACSTWPLAAVGQMDSNLSTGTIPTGIAAAGQQSLGSAPQQGTPQPQPAPASSEEQAKAAAYDKLAGKVNEFLGTLPENYTLPMNVTLMDAFNEFIRQFKANSVAKDSNAAHAKELKDLRENVQAQAKKATAAFNTLGTVEDLLDKYHVLDGRFNKASKLLPEEAKRQLVIAPGDAENLRDAISAFKELGKPKQ